MKKFSVLLIVLLLFTTLLPAKDRLFTAGLGLSSGFPFYGNRETVELNNKVNGDGNRCIIGTLGTINLNLTEQLSFFTDADLLCDFNWNENNFYNHLNYDFSLGFKIYPGLGGFNTGLAYSIGSRSDFKKIDGSRKTINQNWGNGFKIFIEYNFAHNSKLIHLPSIGASWLFMPQGNSTFNNIITAWLLINF